VDAVFTTSNRKKGIDQQLCVKCGECMVACPPDYDAVVKISPAHLAPSLSDRQKKNTDSQPHKLKDTRSKDEDAENRQR
jgi:Fe-S-cluster-containing hydrogenase component 2